MKRLLLLLFSISLVVSIVVGLQVIFLLQAITQSTRALPGAVSAELQATRTAVLQELDNQATGIRQDLTGQVEGARKDLLVRTERQVEGLRSDVIENVADIRTMADRRIDDSLGRVDKALAILESVNDELKPTLDNAAVITAQAKEASGILFRRDALPAQILGLTAAAKVTLGQSAETMRDIQRATPEIVNNIKATTQASTEASKNTAQVMANFAKATKPLPTWARVALAVAPPIVQVGATIATTVALTGK